MTIKFIYESAAVRFHDWGDGTANLGHLYSKSRRKGHASELMKRVMYYADQHGLETYLTVEPYGRIPGMNKKQLLAFYRKFGFRVRVKGPLVIMGRTSQKIQRM